MSTTTHRPPVGTDPRESVWRYFADPEFRVAHADDLLARLAVEAPYVVFPHFLIVSGFDAVRRLSRDDRLRMPNPQFHPVDNPPPPAFVELFRDTLSFQSPADHQRLRGVLGAALTPSVVHGYRDVVDGVMRDLLCEATEAGGTRIQFVRDVADPLPILVTARLLGVPADEEPWLYRQAHGLLAGLQVSFPGTGSHHGAPITTEAFARLRDLVRGLLARPTTPLAAAIGDAVGHEISADEALKLIVLLFMTGVDTVTAALTNTVYQVVGPRLDAVADGAVSAAAVFTEAVRLMTPSAFAPREVISPMRVGGVDLAAGDAIMLCFAAANRDPDRFEDPGAWRPGRTPSATLSFGHGAHHCLGAALAQVQAESVLQALAPLRPAVDPGRSVQWRTEVTFRGPATLPLVFQTGLDHA